MIRTALELIAISLFVAMLLMWAALLSGARAQFMQMQPMPPMAPMQPMAPIQPLPSIEPMQPLHPIQPPVMLQPRTTTCQRIGINVVCTSR